jgi:spermidine/putrescine-binding protein
MHRLTRRSAFVALPALLIALGTGAAAALPAQAASTWSAPAPLPAGAGSQQFAENAAGAQVITWSTYNETTFLASVEVSTSANGLTWSAPVTLTTGSNAAPAPVATIAPNGRSTGRRSRRC